MTPKWTTIKHCCEQVWLTWLFPEINLKCYFLCNQFFTNSVSSKSFIANSLTLSLHFSFFFHIFLSLPHSLIFNNLFLITPGTTLNFDLFHRFSHYHQLIKSSSLTTRISWKLIYLTAFSGYSVVSSPGAEWINRPSIGAEGSSVAQYWWVDRHLTTWDVITNMAEGLMAAVCFRQQYTHKNLVGREVRQPSHPSWGTLSTSSIYIDWNCLKELNKS